MSQFAITNLLQNARDGETKAIMIVEYSHHEIHDGSAYYVEGTQTLSDTEQLTLKFATPDTAKHPHFRWVIVASGETEIVLYEDAAGGMAGGTTHTPVNHHRSSTKSSSMAFVSGVTTSTGVGTRLHNWHSGRDAANPQQTDNPAQSDRNDELVLKRNSTYLGIIASNSSGNNVSFRADWYEHTPSTGIKVAD